jgi:bla regulator protein blaR1
MLLAIAVSYVLVRGSNQLTSGPNISLDTALQKRDAYGSDFLWFKKEGREYLIRDAATLARIQALFDRARVEKPEAKRIKHELRPLEDRESQLDREIDRLTDRDDDDKPLTADEERRLDSLRSEMRDLHTKMRTLERQEEEIDRKRDALEAEAEREMLPILDEAIRTGIATKPQ